MSIEIVDYKEVHGKECLLGFVTIYLVNSKLEISGCTHFRKGDREWVNLPSKDYVDKDGMKKYQPIVRYREKNHSEFFSKHVVEALKKFKPIPKEEKMQYEEQEELPF